MIDLSKLEIELLDFTNIPHWRWVLRRFFVGFLISMFITYGVMFVLFLSLDDLSGTYDQKSNISEEAKDQNSKNQNSSDLVNNIRNASSQENPLAVICIFGLLGSLFSVIRTFVRTVNKKDLPVIWYVTRPVQGILMAILIYYTFRAGQLVFFSGGENLANPETINIYSIAALAAFAGAFTEQAYHRFYLGAQKLFQWSEDNK